MAGPLGQFDSASQPLDKTRVRENLLAQMPLTVIVDFHEGVTSAAIGMGGDTRRHKSQEIVLDRPAHGRSLQHDEGDVGVRRHPQ
ncbi:hypothetical protein [Streptomyces sp. NPDC093544]|uniref:hypothetical protein n=1 Tax=Streptomyces sp. NPDC093544 TaxID=3155200 RepID=UPI00342051A6